MKNGFTLVELVVTIIIISILGVFAFGRFAGNSGFAEVTFQERLVSALRNTQQRAMQDTSNSYSFNLSPSSPSLFPLRGGASFITAAESDFLTILRSELEQENVSLRLNAPNVIGFDALGNPVSRNANNVAAAICTSGCEIDFVGESTARICIEPQGYIHGGDCDA